MNESLSQLLQEVRDDKPSVTSLRLVYKKIGPIEVQHIADALTTNTHITALRLDSNKLGDRGAQILAKALVNNNSVNELNLSNNDIYDEGVIAIADMLKRNKSIHSLQLNHNVIHSVGAAAIADALKVNNTLKILNISCRSISHDGISAISRALKRNQTLQSLHLSGSQCRNYGAVTLGDALKENTGLRLLNLSDCGIAKEGVGSLLDGIKANYKNVQITTINLSHNPIPPELVAKIDKLLELLVKQRKTAKTDTKGSKVFPSVGKQPSGLDLLSYKSTSTTTVKEERMYSGFFDPDMRTSTKVGLSALEIEKSEKMTTPMIPSIVESKGKESVIINYTTTKTVTSISITRPISAPKPASTMSIPRRKTTNPDRSIYGTSPEGHDEIRTPPTLEQWVLEDVDPNQDNS